MSQFSDWERDYGSHYDRAGARAAEPSVLPIDVIEMAGSMVDSQVMTRHDAAVLVMGHVRVTYLGAMSLVSNWRTARQDFRGESDG